MSHSQTLRLILCACLARSAVFSTEPAFGLVTPGEVRRAVGRGAAYLRGSGALTGRSAHGAGSQALAVLAALSCGIPAKDPAVAQALQAIAGYRPARTYETAVVAMALAAADARRFQAEIRRAAEWLMRAQNPDGGWRYTVGRQSSDHSCTQFGLLGLRAANEAGIPVPEKAWRRAEKYLNDTQNRDGGWGYVGHSTSSASMTTAGLGSLFVCGTQLHGQSVRCGQYRQNRRIVAGLKWLADRFSVSRNLGGSARWHFYYLYGLERVGVFSAQRSIGRHDWYRTGAEYLVKRQSPDGSWRGGAGTQLDTCFALLFLAKGGAPILVQKLKHRGDWDNDQYDVKNLVEAVGADLKIRCSWQVINVAAPLADMLEGVLLFLNGHQAVQFTRDERETLRRFVHEGGTIVADACCSSAAFDRSFRAEMREIFPEAPLERLDKLHPVYQGPHKVTADSSYVLEAVTVGCRTGVFYSPVDLSCAWDRDVHHARRTMPVKEAFRLGTNLAAYALGYKPLKDKLDEVAVAEEEQPPEEIHRGQLVLAQVRHNGDWNPDPTAVPNLMQALAKATSIRAYPHQKAVSLSEASLLNYPFLYLTGHREFSFTDEEQARLKKYFALGGFLFADSCCGKRPFDQSFRKLVKELFPGAELRSLPADHPVYRSCYAVQEAGYLPMVRREDPAPPALPLEGIDLGNRTVLIYSPYDIGCGLESHPCGCCRGVDRSSAFRLAMNVIVYAMSE